MSHFTHIKTRFQNLFYLEKALNRLNIDYKKITSRQTSASSLVITQSTPFTTSCCTSSTSFIHTSTKSK